MMFVTVNRVHFIIKEIIIGQFPIFPDLKGKK